MMRRTKMTYSCADAGIDVSHVNTREVLKCKLGNHPFHPTERVPVLLPCGHTFCRECLEGWSAQDDSVFVTSTGKDGGVSCPTCHSVSEVGVADLQVNFALLEVLEEGAMPQPLTTNRKLETMLSDCRDMCNDDDKLDQDYTSHGTSKLPQTFSIREWIRECRLRLISLQAAYRGFSQEKKYQQARARLIALQAVFRGFSQEKKYKQARDRRIRLQAVFGGLAQENKYKQARALLISLQATKIQAKGECFSGIEGTCCADAGDLASMGHIGSMRKKLDQTLFLEDVVCDKRATADGGDALVITNGFENELDALCGANRWAGHATGMSESPF